MSSLTRVAIKIARGTLHGNIRGLSRSSRHIVPTSCIPFAHLTVTRPYAFSTFSRISLSDNKETNLEREPVSTPSSSEPLISKPTVRENIYTIPNLLTVSRIIACPVLGWSILEGDFVIATSLLTYAGLTDWVSICVSVPAFHRDVATDSVDRRAGRWIHRAQIQHAVCSRHYS